MDKKDTILLFEVRTKARNVSKQGGNKQGILAQTNQINKGNNWENENNQNWTPLATTTTTYNNTNNKDRKGTIIAEDKTEF